jgi:NAD(P)-dependent dehydrogenase (short-subunit alcohol dehydrogenase family)
MGRVEGKVALVTGTASGIGKATAKLFAREGARVVAADLNGPGAEATADEIRAAGGEATAVQADISKEADCERMVRVAIERYGRLDILHNHAGVLHPKDGPITELSAEAIDETFAINCRGMLLTVKYAARQMIEQAASSRGAAGAVGDDSRPEVWGGAIVNTGSDLAFIGLANLTAYTASKSAVVGVTRTLAVELARHRIRVNAVCPGFTFSGMNVALQQDRAFMDQMRQDYLIPELAATRSSSTPGAPSPAEGTVTRHWR